MNKTTLTNNKKMRTLSVLLISVLSLLALFGCSDPVSLDDSHPILPEGKGSFSLASSNTSRTIMPSMPGMSEFAMYNLSFTPIGGGVAQSEDRNNATLYTVPVLLEPGVYYLVVNAYKDIEKTILVAQGSADAVTITAGSNTTVAVTLKALASGGTGTFRWNINMPSDVASVSMVVALANGSAAQQSITLEVPTSTGECSLNSGLYNLTFNLVKSDGKTVVWKELLYLYRNLESVFNHTFTNAHFNDQHYTITYKYNDGGLTKDGTQSVLHGGSVPRLAEPVRDWYIFKGWFIDNNTFTAPCNYIQPVTESFVLYAKWDPIPSDGVIINKAQLILDVGDTETLIATVLPVGSPNQNVTWSSGDNTIASVNSSGGVIANKAGSTTITVRNQEGGEFSIPVRVYRSVSADRYLAAPTADVGNDRIKYSYTFDGYDFYYIYLGEMKFIPRYNHTIRQHTGGNWKHSFSKTEATQNSVKQSVTNSSSTARSLTESSTVSTTTGGKIGLEYNLGFKYVIETGIKVTADVSWSEYYSKNIVNTSQQTTSLTNTEEYATSHTVTHAESCEYNFSQDDKPGFYRYSMLSDSDVYLFLIINPEQPDEMYYEFVEYVIPDPGRFIWRLDYSEGGSFGKTDDSGFVFDESILDNLAKPVLNLVNLRIRQKTGTTVDLSTQIGIDARTPVNITAPQVSGYRFANWTKESGEAVFANANSASTTVTLSSNAVIVANYVQIFTLTVSRNNASGGTVSPTSGSSHDANTWISIYAFENNLYKFFKWEVTSGAATLSDAYSAYSAVTFSSDATIRAVFHDAFIDSRNGKKYRVVKIGSYDWMAENLDYSTSGSWSNPPYGRLYARGDAVDVCPTGWKLPNDGHWKNLMANTVVGALKATSGWNNGNGTDASGFSALPGGSRDVDGILSERGSVGLWWSSDRPNTTFYPNGAYRWRITGNEMTQAHVHRNNGYSVRCVR